MTNNNVDHSAPEYTNQTDEVLTNSLEQQI